VCVCVCLCVRACVRVFVCLRVAEFEIRSQTAKRVAYLPTHYRTKKKVHNAQTYISLDLFNET
jgi:hypothetical protein